MIRLQVVLTPSEADALARWAKDELRDPRDQIRFIVRQALEKRGQLTPDCNLTPRIEEVQHDCE